MKPTLGNGKICYIEMPSTDVERSAEFYRKVFGWNIRRRRDGGVSFDDGVGEVSGVWVLGRTPQGMTGLVVYIMVDNMQETLEAITAEGCEIVQPVGADAPEITAKFRDPGGNVLGVFQERE
jgi:predicted enzyme related to lactoylglutathione lyase